MDEKETTRTNEEYYATPDFEVVEIIFEQNLLSTGSNTDDFGDGDRP